MPFWKSHHHAKPKVSDDVCPVAGGLRGALLNDSSIFFFQKGSELPSRERITNNLKSNFGMNHYSGNIQPAPDTVFVFGSNPEGRHGAGAAKIARLQFGAVYGQGEGPQGNAYAIPTKDLRIKDKNGYRSISPEQITASIRKFYAYAKEHPDKRFMIAYRNTYSRSLNGYTGIEMIRMFINAGPIPENIWVSEEWASTKMFD